VQEEQSSGAGKRGRWGTQGRRRDREEDQEAEDSPLLLLLLSATVAFLPLHTSYSEAERCTGAECRNRQRCRQAV